MIFRMSIKVSSASRQLFAPRVKFKDLNPSPDFGNKHRLGEFKFNILDYDLEIAVEKFSGFLVGW